MPKRQAMARYLVDRLWPRGVKREDLTVSGWLKEAAPSGELRKWFGHELQRWDEFRQCFFAELDQNPAAWAPLFEAAQRSAVTLVHGGING